MTPPVPPVPPPCAVVLEKSVAPVNRCHTRRPSLVRRIGEILEAHGTCFVSGFAGTGKSELAREYAEASGLPVLTITLPEHLGREDRGQYDLVRVLRSIPLVRPRSNDASNQQEARQFLESDMRDVLIIVDNFNTYDQDLLDLVCRRPHRVIVTTQRGSDDIAWDDAGIVQIDPDGGYADFACELFARHFTHGRCSDVTELGNAASRAEVRRLVEILKYHPLVVACAASLLRESHEVAESGIAPFFDSGPDGARSPFGAIVDALSSGYDHGPVEAAARRVNVDGARKSEPLGSDFAEVLASLLDKVLVDDLEERQRQVCFVLGVVAGEWVEAREVERLVGDVPGTAGSSCRQAYGAQRRLVEMNLVQHRQREADGAQMVSMHTLIAEALERFFVRRGLQSADDVLPGGEAFWAHVVGTGLSGFEGMPALPLPFTRSQVIREAVEGRYRRHLKASSEALMVSLLDGRAEPSEAVGRLFLPSGRGLAGQLRRDVRLVWAAWPDGFSLHIAFRDKVQACILDARGRCLDDATVRYFKAGRGRSSPQRLPGMRQSPVWCGLVRFWAHLAEGPHSCQLGTLLGTPVSRVAADAFAGCHNISQIDLGPVELVGAGAFQGCGSLASVTVSKGSRYVIESSALVDALDAEKRVLVCLPPQSAHARGSYRVPEGVVGIAPKAMLNCKRLEELDLHDVVQVGQEAFRGCSRLIAVNAPNITTVGFQAFRGCERLLSISLPELCELGEGAFADCGALAELSVGSSTERYAIMGGALVRWEDGEVELVILPRNSKEAVGRYDVPPAVTKIARDAFRGCSNLKEVSVGEVSEVGSGAFAYCSSLEEVRFGKVGYIAPGAFAACRELRRVAVYDEGGRYQAGAGGALVDAARETLLVLPAGSCGEAYSVQAGIRAIAQEAFRDCRRLVEVDLGGVVKLGHSAFMGCGNLERLTMRSVEHVGREALRSCHKLEKVVIGERGPLVLDNGVLYDRFEGRLITVVYDDGLDGELVIRPNTRTIDGGAFRRCGHLRSIVVPGAAEIGADAFWGCSSLEQVVLSGDSPRYRVSSDGMLVDVERNEVVVLPARAPVRELKLDEALRIAAGAFWGCTNLETVDAPWTWFAGRDAFHGCRSLKSASLPQIVQVSAYMFYDCGALECTALPKAQVIRACGFGRCSSLGSIDLAHVERIGERAFAGCSSLRDVVSEHAQSVDDSAFEGCVGLVSVDVPSATQIGQRAFARCGRLRTIRAESALYIGSRAFEGCDSLDDLCARNVRYIGDRAFLGCRSLTSAIVPSATEVGEQAFAECRSLKSVSLQAAESIGEGAFRACKNLHWVDADGSGQAGYSVKHGSIVCNATGEIVKLLLRPSGRFVVAEGTRAIGSYAFAGKSDIVEVVLPSSVTELGKAAFAGCRALERIRYAGTEGEWARMVKGDPFGSGVNPQVICGEPYVVQR